MRYAEIVVLNDHRSTDQLYTYDIPDEIVSDVEVGKRVLIPFGKGNKALMGFVIRITNEKPSFRTKSILKVVDLFPIVSNELIDLAFYLKETTHCNLYRAFKAVGPPGDSKKIRLRLRGENFEERVLTEEELAEVWTGASKEKLKEQIRSGEITARYEIESDIKPKTETRVALANGIGEPAASAIRQRAVLSYLREHGEVSQPMLLKETGASSQTIKSLEEKNWVTTRVVEVRREVLEKTERAFSTPMTLTEEQQRAFDEIEGNPGGHFLLHGVTGSGKTEVYLQLVKNALDRGKSAVMLVPEISLTPQTISRFTGRFGSDVAILHSKLSLPERFEQWKQIRNGEVSIAIGARSAIFAPFDNLGLIIIDEEQEDSYNSETHPRYDTFEVAKWRAEANEATLVLGTATPQMKTYRKAETHALKTVSLTSRVRDLPMPKVEIVDMRDELRHGNTSVFSLRLRERIEQALGAQQQVILFLNKRGHSSFVFCKKCGFVKRCDDCDVSMTYHRKTDVLLCHYCGKTAKIPMVCPDCGSNAIAHFGMGTEQVESYTRQVFPDARVVRMDADTTTTKHAYDDFYEKMKNREVDILIGTQMIAKGLDFEGVSVVGILMADISLNMPDYRANEKTFQLISQVAGRAGRGEENGLVILQTYNPTHFAIQTASTHDYHAFYEHEIVVREHFRYPPFVHMVTVNASSEDSQAALKSLYDVHGALLRFKQARDLAYLTMIGPTPCQIPRIRNKYRYQLTLKFDGHEEQMHKIVDWLQDTYYGKWAKSNVSLQFYIE